MKHEHVFTKQKSGIKTCRCGKFQHKDGAEKEAIIGIDANPMKHTPTAYEELQEAARQVIWKLSHNHDLPDYKGPGRITREDATVKMLVSALQKAGVSV